MNKSHLCYFHALFTAATAAEKVVAWTKESPAANFAQAGLLLIRNKDLIDIGEVVRFELTFQSIALHKLLLLIAKVHCWHWIHHLVVHLTTLFDILIKLMDELIPGYLFVHYNYYSRKKLFQ